MDWNKLRIFHAVAEAGSVTQAAEVLHISQPALSRQVRALESSIGATLFHRHPRGLILTSEGEILYEATREMAARLTAATAHIREVEEGVYGTVQLTTTVDFGVLWLTPRLPKLLEAHPGLIVDLAMTEEILDLPMRAADAAVRMRAPTQADLIARPLRSAGTALYASEAYLARFGEPETLDALLRHHLIAYSRKHPQPHEEYDWLFWERPGLSLLRPSLVVNSLYGVHEAVRAGVGIGVLPDYLVAGGMRRVLPEIDGPDLSLHFVYAREMRQSKRIAALRGFIEAEMKSETSARST